MIKTADEIALMAESGRLLAQVFTRLDQFGQRDAPGLVSGQLHSSCRRGLAEPLILLRAEYFIGLQRIDAKGLIMFDQRCGISRISQA